MARFSHTRRGKRPRLRGQGPGLHTVFSGFPVVIEYYFCIFEKHGRFVAHFKKRTVVLCVFFREYHVCIRHCKVCGYDLLIPHVFFYGFVAKWATPCPVISVVDVSAVYFPCPATRVAFNFQISHMYKSFLMHSGPCGGRFPYPGHRPGCQYCGCLCLVDGLECCRPYPSRTRSLQVPLQRWAF